MRKTLCAVLILSLIICLALPASEADGSVSYKVDGDTLTVSGSGNISESMVQQWRQYKDSVESVVIEYGITAIPNGAFAGFEKLESLSIPESVEKIGVSVLSDSGIYNCADNWDGKVLYIDDCLIEAKENIAACKVKAGTRVIADYAFASSGLSRISLNSELEIIGEKAMSGCEQLQCIVIASSIKSVNAYAFEGCAALSDVYFGGNSEKWSKLNISTGNEALNRAQLHCSRSVGRIDISGITIQADNISAPQTEVSIYPEIIKDSSISVTKLCKSGEEAVRAVKIDLSSYGSNAYIEKDAVVYINGEKAVSVDVTDGGRFCSIIYEPNRELQNNPFTDVSSSAWYYDSVLRANNLGLMSGCRNKLFEPDGTTTRAQLVQVLYNLSGNPETEIKPVFKDVAADRWYARAVSWAYSENITKGVGENMFAPDKPLTREETVTMLYRFAGSPDDGVCGNINLYKDGNKISSWATEAMQWAISNKILQGNEGMLMPKDTTTRAQMAAIITRYYDKIILNN